MTTPLTAHQDSLLSDFVSAVHDCDSGIDPAAAREALHDSLVTTGHIQPGTHLYLDQAEDAGGDPCHGLFDGTGALVATCE